MLSINNVASGDSRDLASLSGRKLTFNIECQLNLNMVPFQLNIKAQREVHKGEENGPKRCIVMVLLITFIREQEISELRQEETYVRREQESGTALPIQAGEK